MESLETRRFGASPMHAQHVLAQSQSALLRAVFGWMTGGLLLTGLVATTVLDTPWLAESLLNRPTVIGLMIVELGLVFWLGLRAMKMSATKATTVFLLYSALNGVTLAPLAMVYTGESISSAFLIAGGMFGAMALFGYTTKRDLSGWRSFLMMGLIGVVLASLVMVFFHNDAMSFIINVCAVIVFTGLTAYDVQRIKNLPSDMTVSKSGEGTMFRRLAILGALSLYLNFINLFISLLQLMGDRR